MNIRLLVVYLLIYLFALPPSTGQLTVPCDSIEASASCVSAPIICDLNCLDGFSATMPNFLEDTLRNILCPSGGNPDNMSWFGFVAGSTTVELEITLTSCTTGNLLEMGVQAGIYSTCAIDDDGNIDNDDVLDCYNPITPSVASFTLFSDQFVVNQVYYFFIDGYSGTICDYEIRVIQGDQPFELDEITSIVSEDSILVDTVCLGYTNYLMRPNIDGLGIDYFWKITPSTPDYPDTFRKLGYETFWDFNYPGDYEVSLYATNGCDVTDTLLHTVTVMALEDEVFDTIYTCYNDFPIDGPLTEDPNGDGVIGWLGPQIVTPGGDITYEVTIAKSGCKYEQKVRVEEIMQKPTEFVTIVTCGAFDYHGTLITQDEVNRIISIPDATDRGCDSIVSLTATFIDIEGDIEVINCDSSGLEIGFITTMSTIPGNAVITYQWFDSNGDLIDNDASTPDRIIIDKRESYGLVISVKIDQDSCAFDIAPKLIDPNDNKPALTAVDWDLIICDDDNVGTYTIQSDQTIKTVQWTIPAGATYINGNGTSESIEVDFSNTNGGNISVLVENFCSGVSVFDLDVTVAESPVSRFSTPIEVCIDSFVVLESLEPFNPLFDYIWEVPPTTIPISGTLNSPGPIELQINVGGPVVPINLIIANGNCIDTFTRVMEVLDPIQELVVDCTPFANSITFNWEDESCAESYRIFRDGILIDEVTSSEYELTGLDINESVQIDIQIISNCLCAGPTTRVECMTLDCSDATLSLMAEDNFICEDFWSNQLTITGFISGGSNMGVVTWVGDHLDQNGIFDALAAGAGVHNVLLQYELDGCIYTEDMEIVLYEQPDLDLAVFDPMCIEDLLGSISAVATGGGGNYNYLLDNIPVTSEVDGVEVGDHTFQIIDANSCQVIQSFTIQPPPQINYSLLGRSELFESEQMSVILEYSGNERALIDSISWFVNGELFCSGPDCLSAIVNSPEPGEYEHNIIIYYNNCTIQESFYVLVKETSKVFIPQAFSPNSDGTNDYWFIGTNSDELVIERASIFDRWGNVVFNKENFTPANEPELWNGSYNGQFVQPGVYVFMIEYVDEFGVKQVVHSDITVLY